jgi:ABC-type bacteriocin/lantibiotic exporter with double-glycine peptidase domain
MILQIAFWVLLAFGILVIIEMLTSRLGRILIAIPILGIIIIVVLYKIHLFGYTLLGWVMLALIIFMIYQGFRKNNKDKKNK